MKICVLLALIVSSSVFAWSGEISGKVTNSQGAAITGAIVTASPEKKGSSPSKTTTQPDGSFNVVGLPPGVYMVTISLANGQALRREVSVPEDSSAVRANFQAAQTGGDAAAAEEFNPNIFIFRIDQNELRNRLQTARGPDPQYIPEFLAEQNFFGAEYGTPLFKFEPFRSRPLIREWRGSLVGFLQNSVLNARNFFNAGPLLPSRSSSYGITAGGPLIAGKLSTLLQFGQNHTSGMVNGNVQEPLATERVSTATDPQLASVVNSLLKAYPLQFPNLPAVSLRQLNSSAPRNVKSTDAQGRLDFTPGGNTSYASRYSVSEYHEDPFQIVLGQNPQTDLRAQTAYLSATKAVSPKTVAQFGFYYDRLALLLQPTREYSHLLSSLGYPSVPDILFSSNPTTYSELYNIGPGPQFPRRRVQNQFQFYGDVSKTMGRHTLKAGVSTMRIQVNDLQSDNSRGAFTFGSDFGRTATQNFLLGTASNFVQSVGNLYRGYRNWEHDLFIQDQIRLRSNLSVSIGARYEIMTAPQEVNHIYDVNFPTDKNNIAPRFGIAWNPGNAKTILRASYGISYGTIPPPTYGFGRFNGPAIQVISQSDPDLLTALNRGYQNTTRSARYLLSPDLVFPYSNQYSFSIERELPAASRLRVAYFGSRSFHLLTQDAFNRAAPDPNPACYVPGHTPVCNTTKNINDRRPDPRYFGIYVIESNSISYFDAAQVSFDKRLSHGLTFRASYSFSKSIDTGGDFTNNATNGQNIGEIGLPACEVCNYVSDHKAVSLFDTPHAVTLSYIYNLPSVFGNGGWMQAFFKGWQISGATIFQSGTPFHLHTGTDSPGYGNVDGESQDRPNVLNPAILGKSIDNPDTSRSVVGADTCVAPGVPDQFGITYPYMKCAFLDTNVPVGGRGNIGMNTFRKKGTNNTNLAVGRVFRMPGDRERSIQFRAEFLNLLNRAQFDKGGNTMSSLQTFAKITNTVNKGRQVQFSLRITF